VRHLLRFVKPLDAKNRWLAIASDELFWNLNDTDNGPVSGFDQNRFYVAGGYNVNPQTRVELGYQLVNIDAPRGRPNRRLDVAMLMVNYNL